MKRCGTCARRILPYDYCIPKGKLGWLGKLRILVFGCDQWWKR